MHRTQSLLSFSWEREQLYFPAWCIKEQSGVTGLLGVSGLHSSFGGHKGSELSEAFSSWLSDCPAVFHRDGRNTGRINWIMGCP